MNDYRLSELMEVISGGTPKTSIPEYWNGDIPWLSVKDFNNDARYVYDTEKHISELGLQKSATNLLVKGDVIISARGTVGEIAMIPFPMAFNQSCYGLRAKPHLVNNVFLYYLIKDKISELKKISHGSVFDTITRDTFDNIIVSLPSLFEQRQIAVILSALDDKIELNTRINKNLEEQFKELYQLYFVTSQTENWDVAPLSELIFFQEGPGIRNWQYVTENGTKFINIRCINNGDINTSTANMISNEEVSGKYKHFMLEENDIVMSCSGTLGRYAIVRKEHLPLCLNTSVIRFKAIEQAEDLAYIYGYLTSSEFLNKQTEMACGSVQSNFGPTHLKKIMMNKPPKRLRLEFFEKTIPLIKAIIHNRRESAHLAAIRDALLPKLMSGELDVSKVDISAPGFLDKLSFNEE